MRPVRMVSPSDKKSVAEVIAVVLTAAGKFLFMDLLRWRLPFIVIAMVGWSAYVLYRSKSHPGTAQHWGFRADNFWQGVRLILPFALAAVVVCVGVGLFNSTIQITWHILPLLVLYPVWGVIQQFLLIALVAGNLQDYKGGRVPKMAAVLISALLFGLVHYPFVWLIIGTFLLALFYGFVYLKQRNLYVLGIFHGWLAAVFFYTVVGRDPFLETFGPLFHLTT